MTDIESKRLAVALNAALKQQQVQIASLQSTLDLVKCELDEAKDRIRALEYSLSFTGYK